MAVQGFDYIVVGAGSAGCILAKRLSAKANVLLVEAGPFHSDIDTSSPLDWPKLSGGAIDWNYMTIDQPGLGGRRVAMPHGRIVGGSSEINGMLWTRGDPAGFDGWEVDGSTGWSYDELVPYFRRIEGYAGSDLPHLGRSGPLHLERRIPPESSAVAGFVEGAVNLGHTEVGDVNKPEGATGTGYFVVNEKDGKRFGARQAYLEPCLQRPTLTVWDNTRVVGLILERARCTGITAFRGGMVEEVACSAEVILSASTVESPKLLMLAGIGPAEHLRQHGIAVRHRLEGVGQGLQEQPAVSIGLQSVDAAPPAELAMAILMHRSHAGASGPDLETIAFSGGFAGPRFMMRTALVRPRSTGTIRLRSSDPSDPPLVDPGIFNRDGDIDRLATGVLQALSTLNTPSLAQWTTGIDPATGLRTEMTSDELQSWIRQTTHSFAHMAGGCRMGVGFDAVVDPQLKVSGLTGLRVCDASVMPSVTSGHSQAAVMAIAERCSDLVLDHAQSI